MSHAGHSRKERRAIIAEAMRLGYTGVSDTAKGHLEFTTPSGKKVVVGVTRNHRNQRNNSALLRRKAKAEVAQCQ